VPISLFPSYGSVLGGTPVQVFGPCFDRYVDIPIVCYFNDIEVEGIFVNENFIICISPPLQELGRVVFRISLNGISIEFEEVVFYSCMYVCTNVYAYCIHFCLTSELYACVSPLGLVAFFAAFQ